MNRQDIITGICKAMPTAWLQSVRHLGMNEPFKDGEKCDICKRGVETVRTIRVAFADCVTAGCLDDDVTGVDVTEEDVSRET